MKILHEWQLALLWLTTNRKLCLFVSSYASFNNIPVKKINNWKEDFSKIVGNFASISNIGSEILLSADCLSPSQSAPTILKNRAPCFLQRAGWKKQGHSSFKKRRDQAASSLFELQWPWFFALCFFQKAGCPIFKKQGVRFLRIVSAHWLGV